MPFPDELGPAINVADYNPDWPAEFAHLAARLQAALGDRAVAIDHVGSTSVPGLAAKNCIDAQVRVTALSPDLVDLLESAGFRCRPEPWNRVEISSGQRCDKLVFAPPVGERATNVHIRLANGPNARYALLFRDYLRADDTARQAWGAFKQRLAQTVTDFYDYGQIKAPATDILIAAAERWAEQTGWTVTNDAATAAPDTRTTQPPTPTPDKTPTNQSAAPK
ncbi:GrpB family protein [Kribbella sp. NPDC058693]|uniref:GrpB family protein n=1 Tax=Kribbella sp. NPDC058693 TaxID=3346602 RepID=UPI00365AFB23